ncbi:hypothetical protein [Streptomyces sp. SID4982]|uniref:hypothetical protein n=1 Tax=Streptomyces sp. SID4982 TaxID=2690291 RepID=UPI00136D13F5|nr:hypothetical protein [Streptomyces sp. SID4982]MYS18074.1 hypothetical protein [Streptomyces sp. SID4982]
MGLFNRNTDNSPEATEYQAAKKALADDPVNRGQLGTVDLNSPAGQQNMRVQARLNAAEANYKKRR